MKPIYRFQESERAKAWKWSLTQWESDEAITQ
jgi:hypothetical protein